MKQKNNKPSLQQTGSVSKSLSSADQQARQKVLGFVLGICVIFTLLFYLSFELWDAYQLSRNGQKGVAEVVRCSRRGKLHRCLIRYKAHKSIYRRWVTPGFFEFMKKGQKVTVHWDKARPRRVKTTLINSRTWFGLLVLGVMLVLFGVWNVRHKGGKGGHPSAPINL